MDRTIKKAISVDMVRIHADTFRRAQEAGVKIAFGTDAGGFDWKIDPAMEFPLMVKYGMKPIDAIRSATTTAANCSAGPIGLARLSRASSRTSSRFPAIH